MELRQSTSVIIPLGPFLDSGDGDTEETGLTINNTDIFIWKEGATSLVNKNSGGATYINKAVYYCTLDSVDTNTLGGVEIYIHMSGALYCVFKGQIVTANYWDSKYSTDHLQVDCVEVSGVSQTGNDNGADINTILNEINNLSVGSGGIATTANSFTKSGSEPETNSYTDTVQEDGTYHIVEDDAGSTDCYYEFNVGNAGIPQSIEWYGYAQSNGDSYGVYFYNWSTTTWDQVGTINGANGSVPSQRAFTATISHVGTGSNVGKVRFRFYSTDGTAIATDRIICIYTQISQGITNGSTITLSESTINKNYIGHNWNLVLGGQDISGSYFFQSINVTGTGTSDNGSPFTFQECNLPNTTLSAYGFLEKCAISALTFTSTSGVAADTIDMFSCLSGVAGSGSPTFDFSGVTKTTNIQVRKWSGGGTWTFTSDCIASIEVNEGGTHTITTGGGDVELRGILRSAAIMSSGSSMTQIHGVVGSITINGTGGTINIYGIHGEINDNSGGSVTINDYGISNDSISDSVWDELLTGGSHNIPTSAGRRLRDLASDIIISGTSPGTGNTTTRIELDGDASSTDGAYDPAVIIITSGTGVGQCRQIFEYDGSNKYAYINRDWKVTPDGTSEYTIIGNPGNTHVNEGVATGGANNTITLNALASSVNNTYVGQVVFLVAGTGQDQARRIISYNGSTKVATVDRDWNTNPISGTIYAIVPYDGYDLATGTDQTTIITHLTDIKDDNGGADFDSSTDSLEAIRDRGDAAWTGSGGGGDATAANQTTIINHLTDIKDNNGGADFDSSTDSLEAIRDRGDTAWVTGGGLSGSNLCTLTIQDGEGNNIVEASVEIWDSAGTTFYERKTTDSGGQTTHNLDDGTYTVKIHKAGYTFTDQTLVVDGTETETYTGTAYSVGSPGSPDTIRIYEYCNDPDDTPVSSLTGTATIKNLPYDYSGSVFSGQEFDGTYDSSTGLVYWDLVKGAIVKFYLPDFGIKYTRTIPTTGTTIRLSDLT